MWSSLFLCNKEALLREINCILKSITEYRDALENDDAERLIEILREGRILKEKSLLLYNNDKKQG